MQHVHAGPARAIDSSRRPSAQGSAARAAVVPRRTAARSGPTSAAEALILQRQIGNRAVGRLLAGWSGGAAASPVEQAIRGARGGGEALPERVRGPMERSFGADFGGVAVHADGRSDALNRALGARAVTTGDDIFFRRGEYRPESAGGRALLAHELTHVVQQRSGIVRPTAQAAGLSIDASSHLEAEADRTGARAARGESVAPALSRYRAAGGRAAAPGALQLARTSWGEDITYSWELEGKNTKIFDYYYDASLFDLEGWRRLRYTRKPRQWWWWTWKKVRDTYPRLQRRFTEDQWYAEGNKAVDTSDRELDGLDILKWYVLTYNDKRYRGLRKMPAAPAYFRDDLLDEGNGKELWETTHRRYEASIGAIFRQVDWNLQNLTLEPNYHFHVAFKRPRFGSAAERNFWGAKIAELGAHLNEYTALRTMEQDNGRFISGKYLGAFSLQTVDELARRLSMPAIPRGADLGLEETDAEGHNLGMFKFGGVALRQTYNRSKDPWTRYPSNWVDRATYPDPERVGFELRAQHDLQATRRIMSSVETILSTFPTAAAGRGSRMSFATGPAGRVGERYRVTNMTRMHPDAQVFAQLHAAGGDSRKVASLVDLALSSVPQNATLPWVMSTDPTLAGATARDNQKQALKIRWSIAFLPWENHEMIPAAQRAAITAARQSLITTLAALHDATNPVAPPANLYEQVQRALAQWAATTHVWHYF